MAIPTTANVGTDILVTWTQPYDSSALITAYNVFFRSADKKLYSNSNCVVTGTPLPTTCTVPITSLTASPFLLQQNDLVQVQIQASNINGWGDLSEVNVVGALIQTRPKQMAPPTRGSSTNTGSLQVFWTALVGDQTGGAPIDSYNLQWDQGTNAQSWYDLTGDGVNFPYSTATTGVFSTGVFAGTTYKMRIRAHNVNGWGDFSTILIIKATGIPGMPLPPTTFIQNLNVKISWTDPVNNFEAITSY